MRRLSRRVSPCLIRIESSIGTLNLEYGYRRPIPSTRSTTTSPFAGVQPICWRSHRNQAGMRDSIRKFGPTPGSGTSRIIRILRSAINANQDLRHARPLGRCRPICWRSPCVNRRRMRDSIRKGTQIRPDDLREPSRSMYSSWKSLRRCRDVTGMGLAMFRCVDRQNDIEDTLQLHSGLTPARAAVAEIPPKVPGGWSTTSGTSGVGRCGNHGPPDGGEGGKVPACCGRDSGRHPAGVFIGLCGKYLW